MRTFEETIRVRSSLELVRLLMLGTTVVACSGNTPSSSQEATELGASGTVAESPSPSEPDSDTSGSAGAGGRESEEEPGDSIGSAGAAGAAGGSAAEEPVCIPSEDPPDADFEDTNCDGIDGEAEHAVFVAPDGSDDAAGSMQEPVQTLQHAIELAGELGKDVYVCNGTYAENIVIEHAVGLYGGYACGQGWRRIADRASIEPESGIPLSILGADGTVTLDRFALRAPAGEATGQSSQAARVVDSTSVQFSRVELRAGQGAPGQEGEDGRQHSSFKALDGASGEDAKAVLCDYNNPSSECRRVPSGGDNGSGWQCTDPHGVYQNWGGLGGDGANALTIKAACNVLVEGGAGESGQPSSGLEDGPSGAPARDGITSTQSFGLLLDDGVYEATNSGTAGTQGARGLPGAGGDGGSSRWLRSGDFCENRFIRGGGGGQGGLGGCAGFAGTPGTGGGASIALVVIDSHVSLDWSFIITRDGGNGGRGGVGSEGQKGGNPGRGGKGADADGNPSDTYAGESGGKGGDGSRGGHAGAGGGGPSLGIIVIGEDGPILNECTFNLGEPGLGGESADGPPAPDGEGGEIYRTVKREKRR